MVMFIHSTSIIVDQPKQFWTIVDAASETLRLNAVVTPALASPAMGHWGTCPPPRLPASYPNPPPAKILREQIRKMYKSNAIFNFWPIFVIFLPTVFLRE